MLKVDDQAPDCSFEQANGEKLELASFRGQPLVLIFLRHLAWLPCQEHLGEVQEVLEEIESLGAKVLVVTFSAADRIDDYVALHKWPFQVVSDPEFKAYKSFGLPKGSLWQVAGLRVLIRYFGLLFSSRTKLGSPEKGDDVWQMGGDFIIGADGKLTYVFRSRRSTERPSPRVLVDALRDS